MSRTCGAQLNASSNNLNRVITTRSTMCCQVLPEHACLAIASRAQGLYSLDRMEIGSTRILGDLAVVNTVLYGRLVNPIQAEGKIVVQQYLMREEGKWRVATGDQTAVRKFLTANPQFSKGFKIQRPRVFVKQEGKWVEFNPPRRR